MSEVRLQARFLRLMQLLCDLGRRRNLWVLKIVNQKLCRWVDYDLEVTEADPLTASATTRYQLSPPYKNACITTTSHQRIARRLWRRSNSKFYKANPHGAQLMLIHLTTDRLCQWHPRDETLSSLTCKYCIVDRSTPELREHFGTCENSYGHWIDLSLPHGRYPLWQLLRQYPDVALPQCRDIAPLRLVFLGVLWSSGPCSTSFAPADDALWGSCPSLFRWGPCDW